MNIYSGVPSIPRRKAVPGIIEGCLALEGGAFRGVYTSGVLDVFMENGINFRTTVGVSAGSLNAVNYTAGHIGRSAICNLRYRHDSRWVGLKALKSDHGLIGFDFLKEGFQKDYPFDETAFLHSGRHCIAVATDMETGNPEYFDSYGHTMDDVYRYISASSSMPFASRPVIINGRKYLDGGCSTKTPIRWALEQGFDKLVFVGTNIASLRRPETTSVEKAVRVVYSRYPAFVRSVQQSNIRYNEDCDLIDKAVSEGKMFRINPSEAVTVSRLEGDMEKLGALYQLGRKDASSLMGELKEYLSIK